MTKDELEKEIKGIVKEFNLALEVYRSLPKPSLEDKKQAMAFYNVCEIAVKNLHYIREKLLMI